ncbi:efflux RND transporter periplasmic adaptor subunit [Alkalihalobacillus deserti]|uniref:efflux RND transporter periplasmic adaptor subunit n=1 Tax=Alkalihalobacillus deserti TaxID=2879466 RepID=UPI001D15C6C9|nr:HlyD family efflux transporter periplasmic adaptor subunit [Alkalihalobacillus deserti]
MKAWIKYTLIFIGTLLITLNIVLILQDESQIDRLQIIDRFLSPLQVDIVESIEKPGIISSISEEHIYYNENLGSLGTVFVEEGQEVQFGEVLFSYHNIQLGSAERELELNIEKNNLRSSQLADEIYTLTTIKDTLVSNEMVPGQETLSLEAQLAQYNVQIEEKQHQMATLQLETEMYHQSLSTLSEQQAELEITSPATGVIKEINTNQNMPFITLLPTPFVAKGKLTEAESLDIDEGMKVEVQANDHEPIEGMLSKISQFPSEEPSIEQVTSYPFVVELTDLEADLKIGFHVNLNIIQKEIPNAIVIPADSFLLQSEEKPVVYVADEGNIAEKTVTLGMIAKDKQEVISGLTTADLLVDDPLKVISGQPFVTKVRLSELEKSTLSSFRKKELLKLTLRGFLQ